MRPLPDPPHTFSHTPFSGLALVLIGVFDRGDQPAELAAQLGFEGKLGRLAWVAYAPTGFDPTQPVFPDPASNRAELGLLHAHGFDGLITFGADRSLSDVPRIATEIGFAGVIVGVFMGTASQSAEELRNAIAAAEFVDGYSVGDEGLIGCGGDAYNREQSSPS